MDFILIGYVVAVLALTSILITAIFVYGIEDIDWDETMKDKHDGKK